MRNPIRSSISTVQMMASTANVMEASTAGRADAARRSAVPPSPAFPSPASTAKAWTAGAGTGAGGGRGLTHRWGRRPRSGDAQRRLLLGRRH